MANTVSRSLHDLGLAAWFGGTLANAVALNRAAGATTGQGDAGALIVVSAFAGEQQRPANLLSGLVRRVAG